MKELFQSIDTFHFSFLFEFVCTLNEFNMNLIRVNGMREYSIINQIGEGSYSKVYRVQKNHSSEFYAMKSLKKRYRTLEEVYQCQEIHVLGRISGNQNVLELKDVIYEPEKQRLSLFTELFGCNLLEAIAPSRPHLTFLECLNLIYQLLTALSFIHSKGYIHRDIKPENCLIDKNTMKIKLCDFGSAKQPALKGDHLTDYIATRWYRAPELLLSGDYGISIDIWSVGCVFYEIITKKPLFPGANTIDQLMRIHSIIGDTDTATLSKMRARKSTVDSLKFIQPKSKSFTIDKLKNLLPNIPVEAIDLIQKLLIYSPENRISASDALKHRIFKLLSKEKIPHGISHNAHQNNKVKTNEATFPQTKKNTAVPNISLDSNILNRSGKLPLRMLIPKVTVSQLRNQERWLQQPAKFPLMNVQKKSISSLSKGGSHLPNIYCE